MTTLDLRAAYKQLALSLLARAMSVVVLQNPSPGEVGCFVGKALCFGSTASVAFFNRVAWFVGVSGSNF